MGIIKSYQDLCGEIDILELMVNNLEAEYSRWKRSCLNGDRKPIAPLNVCLTKMDDIRERLQFYGEMLKEKEATKRQIERRMNEFEGIEYKVSYMRDIEGMTLYQIAAELGYSYPWIRKVSGRTKKQTAL